MITSTTRFDTANGSRYLQQLCKHFSHKVDIDYDQTSAHAQLPPGPARLIADGNGIDIEVTGSDAEGLDRAKHIVEDHLLRFAFRENPAPLTWTV